VKNKITQNGKLTFIIVGDQMFLGMQDFDFPQI